MSKVLHHYAIDSPGCVVCKNVHLLLKMKSSIFCFVFTTLIVVDIAWSQSNDTGNGSEMDCKMDCTTLCENNPKSSNVTACKGWACGCVELRHKKKLRDDIDSCSNKTRVDKQLAKSMMRFGNKVAHTKELNCFAACILQKREYMNSDGSFVNGANDSDAIKQCKKQSGGNTCEIGRKAMDCFVTETFMIW